MEVFTNKQEIDGIEFLIFENHYVNSLQVKNLTLEKLQIELATLQLKKLKKEMGIQAKTSDSPPPLNSMGVSYH